MPYILPLLKKDVFNNKFTFNKIQRIYNLVKLATEMWQQGKVMVGSINERRSDGYEAHKRGGGTARTS